MVKRIVAFVLTAVVVIASATVVAAIHFQKEYDILSQQGSLRTEADQEEQLPTLSNVGKATEAFFGADASTVVGTDEPEQTERAAADASTLRAQQILEGMTLQEKICQMLFVSPEVLTGYTRVIQSGTATQRAFEKYPVGGVIYFSQNLISVSQTTTMLENLQQFSMDRLGFGVFIGVDEEGGSVARVASKLGTTKFDDMAVYGAEENPQRAYEIGNTIAGDLHSLGFNVDFAPVADVLTNESNTAIGDRSFGSDPDMVSEYVAQEVSAFVTRGVLCSPKHFPGQGSVSADTHNGYASSDRIRMELDTCDLRPFQAAMDAGAPMIMVGHMTMTSLDADYPASLSPSIVTGILRQTMGYDGIVITDAMNMSAITSRYISGEAAVLAVQAGCDMLLCVYNLNNVISALTQAVEDGTITEERINESVTRILTAKLQYGLAA